MTIPCCVCHSPAPTCWSHAGSEAGWALPFLQDLWRAVDDSWTIPSKVCVSCALWGRVPGGLRALDGNKLLGKCPELLPWIQRLWLSSNWIIPFVLPGQIPTQNWGFSSCSRHPSSDSSSLKPRRDDPGPPAPDPDPYTRPRVWDQPRDVGNTVANRSCWPLVAAFPLCQCQHYPNFCMEYCSCTGKKNLFMICNSKDSKYIYFFPLHNPDAWNLYLHLSTGLIYFNPKQSSVEFISVRVEF